MTMRKAQFFCISAIFAFLAAVPACGDTMVIRNKTHEGTFEGFEKNMFRFRTAEGEFLKEKRGKVSKILLEEPCKVTFLRSGKKESESGMFKKYERLKFIRDKRYPGHQLRQGIVRIPESDWGVIRQARRSADRQG